MVSIVMPAYNAEKYIGECIDSILSQTFTDWELIIVDDGSSDGTPLICRQYAGKDPRIKVIRQENRGVSGARNRGLENVSGGYIAFVDADDYLPPESLSVRVELICGADMAVAGYELFNKGGILERMPRCVRKEWDTHEAVRNIIAAGELGYQGYTVNKLFRTELIEKHGIRFNDALPFNEDRLFCVSYALQCSTVNLSDELVYRYRMQEENASSSVLKMTDRDILRFNTEFQAFDRAMELVKGKYEDCYYIAAAEAQYRAVVLKRRMKRKEKLLAAETDRHILRYGKTVLSAPPGVISLQKKAAVLAHMALLK